MINFLHCVTQLLIVAYVLVLNFILASHIIGGPSRTIPESKCLIFEFWHPILAVRNQSNQLCCSSYLIVLLMPQYRKRVCYMTCMLRFYVLYIKQFLECSLLKLT